MYIFDKMFPFVKKEFGKEVSIDSVDGVKNIKAIAYIKNRNISGQTYFNDKVVYCEKEIKPGDIIKCEDVSYMCIRQIAKHNNYWVTTIRQCDFIIKFVVGTEVKATSSYFMSQNFKISEGLSLVSSDSTMICVIPDYVWTNNLAINQKFIQFGFRWLISGIDKTNKGLVYIHANRGEPASGSENASGIPDGSIIYSSQILWNQFPGYLEEGNKYPIEAKLYKQLPDLTWVPTVEKIVYRTSDSSIAYVDNNTELLHCVKKGKTRVYAEYMNDYSKSIYKDIEVNEVFVNYRMDWVNSVSSMYTDDTYKFTAQVFKNDVAITVPILYEIPEEYSDIAELGVNGNVTAKKAGTFIITATWTDNPNYRISKQVTVEGSTYTVKFYKYATKLKLNSKTDFGANVYKNGTIDASKSVRYSSDNVAAVQIDANTGEVNPVGLGKANIKAYMVDDLSVYEEVATEVFETVYSIIWKQQITEMMYMGQTYKIEAVVGVDLEPDLTKAVGYRSSNESVVTVDSEGNVTPVSQGSAELTAYYVDDESISASLLVNVSLNKYTIEWVDPQTPSYKFISYGEYTDLPDRIDLGVIIKRDGVDVTSEYNTNELYHFKEEDPYSKCGFNGRYISGGSKYIFRQVSVTVSIPNIPDSPTLTWEGAMLPSANGSVINPLNKGSGQIQLMPDTSVTENGIVLGQDTLLSTDIKFAIQDFHPYAYEGVKQLYQYVFKYSDLSKGDILVETYEQSQRTGDWVKTSDKPLPNYIKKFFETYPDAIYPKVTSLQPEVITTTNTPKQHFAYLRGNYIAGTRIYQSINQYYGINTYQYRSIVDVKNPNGLAIYMTFGKKIYSNQHNGIMAYATLNGERLDDEGMVFEIVDSNNTGIELRKFPKVVTGHFGNRGKPNVLNSVLETDDGWCAFSDSYKQRKLLEESGVNTGERICDYPYNRQILKSYKHGNDYFVNQSWKFQRDENNEIVYENNMRDVFITGSISSSRNIKIKAYHKDYPNFSETREYTVYPSDGQNLAIFFAVRDNTSDNLEYEGVPIGSIDISNLPDNNSSQQVTYSIGFPRQYNYISLYVADRRTAGEMPRYEDRYDYGYWNISVCKEIDAESNTPPNLRQNYGTTNYPRQTIIHVDDWDKIINKVVSIYIQPASLLVDSSRYSGRIEVGYLGNPHEVEKEIEYYNQFPKVRNMGVQQNADIAGTYYYTKFWNVPHPYEEHVVNDAVWIDTNYDALTNFRRIYGTQNGSPYPDGDYNNVDMSSSETSKRLWERFAYKKLMFLEE